MMLFFFVFPSHTHTVIILSSSWVCVCFVFRFLWHLHFFSCQPDLFVSMWITHVLFSQFVVCFSLSQSDFILSCWLVVILICGVSVFVSVTFLYLFVSLPLFSLFLNYMRESSWCVHCHLWESLSLISYMVMLYCCLSFRIFWRCDEIMGMMCVCFFLYVSSVTFTYNIVRQFHSFSSYTFLVKLNTHIAKPFWHSLVLWSFVSCLLWVCGVLDAMWCVIMIMMMHVVYMSVVMCNDDIWWWGDVDDISFRLSENFSMTTMFLKFGFSICFHNQFFQVLNMELYLVFPSIFCGRHDWTAQIREALETQMSYLVDNFVEISNVCCVRWEAEDDDDSQCLCEVMIRW